VARSAGIHILGIAGTFMAGVAALAKEAGIPVTGCDAQIYPPMSTLLDEMGIAVSEGYDSVENLQGKTIVIGNALSRGNASVEYTLNHKLPFTSGPQWLRENVLGDKTVLAVAGTHGKTTTASILAWILHTAHPDSAPGFLIGGKPGNFKHSARMGDGRYFVVEADEYDTAYFDKRSKFVHYYPDIAILNNLEFDHADIFADLDAIKTQFHHLIRGVPQNGKLIVNADEPNLLDVLGKGCWTPVEYFSINDDSCEWYARECKPDCRQFEIQHHGQTVKVSWPGMGRHNMSNALAAVVAACQTGIKLASACRALKDFRFPAKRLQAHSTQLGFTLYEDFAHHPTAIANTLETLRKSHPGRRLIALLELRSNTMKMGVHADTLIPALNQADIACIVNTGTREQTLTGSHPQLQQFDTTSACRSFIEAQLKQEDLIVVMSNGNFDDMTTSLKQLC
jgi:UDP-N-acetylmuramate: L-alanyl-gamma-D-glutamyl-meso-diaminopimelate ligase